MLRDRDYLLTLAAVWLLVASLNSKSRPNFVITASAASRRQPDGHSYFEQSSQPMQVDVLMSKIKQNLDQPKRQLQPLETRRVEAQPQASQPTNFSHYEDHADNSQQAQQRNQKTQFGEAKEVRVDRLRSNRKSPAPDNATSSVFMLSQSSLPSQQLVSNHIDGDNLAGSEQQQQQPFLFAPNSNPLGQQQQQHQDMRHLLQNYQRNPQFARQLTDQQRQMLTQLQPRPPQLHLRPPTSPAPAFGLANGLGGPQQPQQMLSPLQLLAGPLQAFLPALTANQQQQSNQLGDADRRPASGATPAPNTAAAPQQQQQQQQPLGGLLSAFNLAPNRPNQQQGGAAPNGLANLQDFYQQLPLYQALLAARQRQEALQAGERVRQQQQGPFNLMPPLAPPHTPAPNTVGSGGNALPLPPAPPFATGPLPPSNAFGLVQPQAQPPSNGNQNLWPPPPPQKPANAAGQQQAQRPPATSNQEGPVQFDDDEDGQRANNNDEPGQQRDQNKNDRHDNGNRQPADNNLDNNNLDNNNNNNNDDAGDQQNQGDSGQPQNNNQADQNEAAKVQEEAEDPDLKQFQNLADGAGDPLSDFGIPKGFMSDNDVNEIKSQQAEQARRQEAEERQRQQQQQQQQQQRQANNQNAPDADNNSGQIDNSNQNNETGQPQDNQDEQDDENEGGEQAQGQPGAAALTAKSSSASETTKRTKLAGSPGVEYAK